MGSKSSRIAKGKQVIAEGFETAGSLFARMRGLMFRKEPKTILFKFGFPGRHSIHSFFVFFPFDAVFLDEKKKVVSIHKSITPFTPLITPSSPALFLLELPSGSSEKFSIKPGDVLDFEV